MTGMPTSLCPFEPDWDVSTEHSGQMLLQGLTLGESSTDDEPVSRLGPLLPYHEDDEDLLLNVMITKQVRLSWAVMVCQHFTVLGRWGTALDSSSRRPTCCKCALLTLLSSKDRLLSSGFSKRSLG